MSFILIGFSGRSGSGKSTAANVLVETGGFEVLSFAQPIKEMAATLLMAGFGYKRERIDHYLANKELPMFGIGASMRYLLQTLGTEWGRGTVDSELWVKSMKLRCRVAAQYSNVAIDDVRFEDEAAYIRSQGGLVIHLKNNNSPFLAMHPSEQGILVDERDVMIENTGTLDDLRDAVNQAIAQFTRPHDRLLQMCLTPCREYGQ